MGCMVGMPQETRLKGETGVKLCDTRDEEREAGTTGRVSTVYPVLTTCRHWAKSSVCTVISFNAYTAP